MIRYNESTGIDLMTPGNFAGWTTEFVLAPERQREMIAAGETDHLSTSLCGPVGARVGAEVARRVADRHPGVQVYSLNDAVYATGVGHPLYQFDCDWAGKPAACQTPENGPITVTVRELPPPDGWEWKTYGWPHASGDA